MEKATSIPGEKMVYYRLIALWVVCEALVGGIIHGLRLPVSGLIVGSSAVVCISMIAWNVPRRGSIIKATIIVAAFKMMLSPQSPLAAYFAVFFQGMLGELLFFNKRYYQPAAFLFGILSLLESGFQRILVVTIIYGKQLWTAINEFIDGFTSKGVDYSTWLISLYLMFHLFAGILVGWFAATLPKQMRSWQSATIVLNGDEPEWTGKGKKRKKLTPWLLVAWILLLLLFLQSWLHIGTPILPSTLVLQLLLRSLLILLTWYLVLGPLLTGLLKLWLEQKKAKWKTELDEVLLLLPSTRRIFQQSWQLSSSTKGFKRLGFFCRIVLVNTLHHA